MLSQRRGLAPRLFLFHAEPARDVARRNVPPGRAVLAVGLMSARHVILLLLTGNAVLASALYWRTTSKPQVLPETAIEQNRPRTIVRHSTAAPEIVTTTQWQQIDWTAVESPDYLRYIANLRSIKCPEETIRDIIIADVNKLYASKWRALQTGTGGWKFWESDRKKSEKEARHSEDRKALEEERAALVKELLGVDLKAELKKYAWDESGGDRRYDFLPEVKQTALRELEISYKDAMRAELEALKKSGASREVLEARQAELKQQFQKELAGVLTPLELEEYHLRHSNLADRLRRDLAGLEPTEQEFRSLFRMLSGTFGVDGASAKSFAWNDAGLVAGLGRTLGEDRASQLTLAGSTEFEKTAKAIQKLGGSLEDARRVAAIQQTMDEALAQAMNNPQLTPEQRSVAVDAIKKERKALMTAAMGEKPPKKKK